MWFPLSERPHGFRCKRQLVVGDFGQTPTSNSFHAHFNNQTKMAPWDTRGITSRTDRLPYPDCFRSPTSPNSALRPYTAGDFSTQLVVLSVSSIRGRPAPLIWEDFFGQFHCQTTQGTPCSPKGRHSVTPKSCTSRI